MEMFELSVFPVFIPNVAVGPFGKLVECAAVATVWRGSVGSVML